MEMKCICKGWLVHTPYHCILKKLLNKHKKSNYSLLDKFSSLPVSEVSNSLEAQLENI